MLKIPSQAPSYVRDLAAEIRAQLVNVSNRQGVTEGALRSIQQRLALLPTDYGYSWEKLTAGANTTLGEGYMNRMILLDCTSSAEFTLPEARHGGFIGIFNAGTGTGTIKDGSTTLCTLPTDTLCFIQCIADSSLEPVWPSRIATWNEDGTFTPGLDPGYMTHPQVMARTLGS